MNDVIKEFYDNSGLPQGLVDKKLDLFEANPDISNEFVYWIENSRYREDGLTVNGYSAEQLALDYPYLKGEGAFILLIELRSNPENALKRIKEGFKKR